MTKELTVVDAPDPKYIINNLQTDGDIRTRAIRRKKVMNEDTDGTDNPVEARRLAQAGGVESMLALVMACSCKDAAEHGTLGTEEEINLLRETARRLLSPLWNGECPDAQRVSVLKLIRQLRQVVALPLRMEIIKSKSALPVQAKRGRAAC